MKHIKAKLDLNDVLYGKLLKISKKYNYNTVKEFFEDSDIIEVLLEAYLNKLPKL